MMNWGDEKRNMVDDVLYGISSMRGMISLVSEWRVVASMLCASMDPSICIAFITLAIWSAVNASRGIITNVIPFTITAVIRSMWLFRPPVRSITKTFPVEERLNRIFLQADNCFGRHSSTRHLRAETLFNMTSVSSSGGTCTDVGGEAVAGTLASVGEEVWNCKAPFTVSSSAF